MTAHSDPVLAQQGPERHKALALLDNFFSSIGQGFNAYLESHGRLDRVRRLNAKSDAELAEMGLTRDGIAHHVFRDLF